MATVTTRLRKSNLGSPDEVRSLPKTRVEVCKLGDHTLLRATFEPGWKWSECVKPKVGTEWCEVPHLNYAISGRLQIVMRDGSRWLLEPGDFAEIPAGHDAWVVGDEPVVALDFIGGETYGKPSR